MGQVTKVNLIINKGATFRQKFAWKDAKGRAIDLTGYTARMHIRAEMLSTDILVSLTTVNGGIVITPLVGLISLYLTDVQTSALTVLKGVYDIELVSSLGEVERLVGGNVSITPEVTR